MTHEANNQNTANARVQRYRAKLRAEHCRRLEVWIGIPLIEQVRAVARQKKLRMWEAVQEALDAYVTGYAGADTLPDNLNPKVALTPKAPDVLSGKVAVRVADRRERMTRKTAQAIRLYDTDPEISAYKAALVTGITPSTLYRALAARERLLSDDGCRSRLVSPR